MNYFADLDVSNIRNKTIFLDVDGTILNDGQNNIGHKELLKIEQIKANNTIYLCSNKKDHYRNSLIAENCGAHYLKSDYRKPSKKALNLPNFNPGDSIVIGDKFLTDGLFAWNVGALFIKVKRIISPKDSFFVKSTYFFDNSVYFSFVCIKALRPNQWVKNLLVFIPVFFAKEIFIASKFLNAILFFLIFCLVASAMYIINDILDKQQDKKHYRKKFRPIASGDLTIKQAIPLSVSLVLIGGLALYYLLPQTIFVILGYIILNLLYSTILKKIVIFDILTISVFYFLRIIGGGLATSTYISPWLVLCLIFISLFVIVGKRKAELNLEEKRTVLKIYDAAFLSNLLNISGSLTLMSYGLYTVLVVSSAYMVYSIFFVLIGVFRYFYIISIFPEKVEFPEKIIITDKIIFGSVAAWFLFLFLIFYYI